MKLSPFTSLIVGILFTFVVTMLLTYHFTYKINKIEKIPNSRNNAIQYVNACDYQIEFVEDSMIIWDGRRYVGTLPMWDNSPLDSLLQKDNE